MVRPLLVAAVLFVRVAAADAQTPQPTSLRTVGHPPDTGISHFNIRCQSGERVTGIYVRAGWYVDAVGVYCETAAGQETLHRTPGTGGQEYTYRLKAGDRVSRIGGLIRGPYIGALQVGTRGETSLLLGNVRVQTGEEEFALDVPSGSQFIGFHGSYSRSSGNYVHTLGLVVPPGANAPPVAVAAPRLVPLDRVTEVVAGGDHTCAVAGQTVWCWGDNTFGQLGDGTTTERDEPVRVAGDAQMKSLTLGADYSCARGLDARQTRIAFCWGRNTNGQLGDGTTTNRSVPTTVQGSNVWNEIVPGPDFTCGRRIDAADLHCWGRGGRQWMGAGSASLDAVPAPVQPNGQRWSFVRLGGRHFCVGQSGPYIQQLSCWGNNDFGQLGDGTVTSWAEPIPVKLPRAVRTVELGETHSCAASREEYNDARGTPPSTIYCWGDNRNGQLGDGTPSYRSTTAVSPQLAGRPLLARVLTVGARHSCVIDRQGEAFCWGANDAGQLGDGTTEDRNTAVKVMGGHRWQAISAGTRHTCGITRGTDSRLFCWGSSESGRLGIGAAAANGPSGQR